MIQNIYYRPKVYSEAEVSHPDRYNKGKNIHLKDDYMYQRSVTRKDVTGKMIKDIRHNLYGEGQMDTIKKKERDNKPDLIKSLFFRNSMTIQNCGNVNNTNI